MTTEQPSQHRPAWVSDDLYPFASHYLDTPGGRLHYLDEGQGRPLVLVHGNPSWSFEYRALIAALRGECRCVAPDHLGFGLSGRSTDPAHHHPAFHARNFAALMDHLGLERAVLCFSDWGGPIALDFARRHPGRVAGLVILNSWCWSVEGDPHFAGFSRVMSSWPIQLLIRRFNFFVKQVMPKAVGNRAILTPEVMAHYVNAQPTVWARAASAALPGHIIGASDWLQGIWDARAAFVDKPALLLWGLRDIAFRPQELLTWQAALRHCTVHEFPECGHFVAEEAPWALEGLLREFMAGLDG